MRALLICLFLFLTAPVAAHMIARAAYHGSVPLSGETIIDELREREFDSSFKEGATAVVDPVPRNPEGKPNGPPEGARAEAPQGIPNTISEDSPARST